MTRRDYVLLSGAFREARARAAAMDPTGVLTDVLQPGLNLAANAVAKRLKNVNSAFDIVQFLRDAGVE